MTHTGSLRAVFARFARSRSTAALAACGALLGAGALHAQEPADTFQLEELVVTATRVPVPLEAVAAAVTVIEGDELRPRGGAYLLDALRGLVGVSVSQTGSFGAQASLFVRGGESDYVQVLIDGVPINDPGGSVDLSDLSTAEIERVEIVRGPASVLYGSDAVSGVIQIFTRRGGPAAARAWAAAKGGRAERVGAGVAPGEEGYGTLELEAGVRGGGERLDYALGLSRFDTEGAYAFNNGFTNTVLNGQVRVRPDARTDARLSARVGDGEFHFPTDGAGALVDRNAVQTRERLTLAFEAGRRLTDRLEARLLLGSSTVDAVIDDRADDAADTLGVFAYRTASEMARRSADLRLNYHLGPATVLTAGAELERQQGQSSYASESQWGPFATSLDVERSNRAYYAQTLAGLGDRLYLNAGARLEDNEAFGTFGTYRAGAAYRLPTQTRLRAALGTGFKEPTFIENYSEGFAVGNPDLQPERSRSWEVALEQELLGGRATISGTWFDQQFADLIQYKGQPFGSAEPNFFNIGEATAAGLELQATALLPRGVTLGATFTSLRTEVTDPGFDTTLVKRGTRLLRRPDNSASAFAAWTGQRAGVRLDVARTGERDDLDFSGWPAARVQLPAHTRVDLAAHARLLAARGLAPAVTLTARIENLTGEAYEEIANFPARGRALYLGVRLGEER